MNAIQSSHKSLRWNILAWFLPTCSTQYVEFTDDTLGGVSLLSATIQFIYDLVRIYLRIN